MTVKEISQFTGKTERTVQNWVKKVNEKSSLFNEKFSLRKGQETDFNIDEVEAILTAGTLSKDAVSILMSNARQTEVSESQFISRDDMQIFIKTAIQATVKELMPYVVKPSADPLPALPAPEISKRQQIIKLVNGHAHRTGKQQSTVYHSLYKDFSYIYHRQILTPATRRKMTGLEYIEEVLDMIDELYTLAQSKLKAPAVLEEPKPKPRKIRYPKGETK